MLSIRGCMINIGKNTPIILKYNAELFVSNINNKTLSGNKNSSAPIRNDMEKENNINNSKRVLEALISTASTVYLVHSVPKRRAHIESTVIRVFLTKENSPNSFFVSNLAHMKVAITKMTFANPLPIIVMPVLFASLDFKIDFMCSIFMFS